MRTERLSNRAFQRQFGRDVFGVQDRENGEAVIYFPRRASLRSRLHEIAHAKLGHEGKAGTYGDLVQRELEADAWAYERLGRHPTWGEVLNDFFDPMRELFGKGFRVNVVFAWVVYELDEAGYEVNQVQRSNIWWEVRRFYYGWRRHRRR